MAGFDTGAIYSTQIGHQDTPAGGEDEYSNNAFIKRKFKEFIKNFTLENYDFLYRDQLRQHYSIRQFSITVQVEHVKKFSKSLYEELLQRPSNIVELFEVAATEVLDEITRPRGDDNKLEQVQVLLAWDSAVHGLRDLRSDVVAGLVKIQGIVTSVSSRRSKATSLTLQCRNCRSYLPNLPVKPGLDGIMLPRRCQNSTNNAGRDAGAISFGAANGRGALASASCPLDPYFIVPDKCRCVDFQLLKLQEAPENVPQGEMPRTVQLYVDRHLCDKAVPGNRVNVVGIYLIKNSSGTSKGGGTEVSGVRQAYLRILGLEQCGEGLGGGDMGLHSASTGGGWSAEQEEEFRRIAHCGNVYDLIAKSIAPAIYGSQDIKKAIACMLIGGSKKRLPDGLTRRGDINVLLLGDPGTAKSQLLKFVERASPIGVYTSGKGSSAAGLTASVIRDPASRTFVMEGGAMVLADGGVVCIDEFDKMREDDRVAIHEAMEQQTISIAKAGITTTLNTRCSVFAAANSVYGRWDDTKGEENIDFMPTILSRFDMIFVVKDEHDLQRDTTLAMHVMKIHLEGGAKHHLQGVKGTASGAGEDVFEEGCQELSLSKLQQFVAYCRQRCGPRLSEAAALKLRAQYVLMRAGAGQMEEATGRRAAIPLTVRQLEAVIRISESLAKMRLSPWATEADVEEALRLFSVSTLAAANTGQLDGAEGFTSVQEQEKIVRIEKQIKKRFLVGSQVSEQAILQDFSRQGYEERSIAKVLTLMLRRGELQHRMQRRILYRVK